MRISPKLAAFVAVGALAIAACGGGSDSGRAEVPVESGQIPTSTEGTASEPTTAETDPPATEPEA
ncbi:MAG: hypothetical protein ABJ382_14060, partial [Ilumatobacter sp.]